jgi:N-acetylmuramoyl-L-alanine amidase
LNNLRQRQRISGQFICLLLLGVTLSVTSSPHALAASSKANKRQRAKTAYEKADQLRAALEGKPIGARRVADFERVANALKQVYVINPASPYTPDALLAVAEIHNQMAGELKKPAYYRKAIEDYQFLIKEYPSSKLNKDALFTIGLIYQNDLGDNKAALQAFEEYIKKYKQGPKVIAARENVRQLKKIEQGETTRKQAHPEREPSESKSGEGEDAADQSKSVDISRLPQVSNIRHWSTSNYTRVVIDIDSEVQFDQSRLSEPDRLFFNLKGARLSSTLMGKTFPVEDGFLREIRVGQFQASVVRIVLDLEKVRDYTVFPLYNPFRLVIDIRGANPPTEKATTTVEKSLASEAKRTEPAATDKKGETRPSSEESSKEKISDTKAGTGSVPEKTSESVESSKKEPRSTLPKSKGSETKTVVAPHAARPRPDSSLTLTQSLGLKIGKIVIDPGHGGHDYGTIGPGGLAEKDLALDVSLRLGKLLENKLGSQVIYTRDDDTFVPLENRTALANQKQADLFISVHANSSRNSSASGVETFFLGIASKHDQETLDVVSRENAFSERSLHDLQDVIKKITLNEKVEESKEFAASIQKSMVAQALQWNRSMKNRGVKKAHFIVLIGANMPSILTEISFLSNPNDERLLKKPDYRQRMAQALYDGIVNYIKTLSGIKVAGKIAVQD